MEKELQAIQLYRYLEDVDSTKKTEPRKVVTLLNILEMFYTPTVPGAFLKVIFNSYADMLKAKELTNWEVIDSENALRTYTRDGFVKIGQDRFFKTELTMSSLMFYLSK